ncbi:polysaccharide deacetylase family protein [Pelosinus sp. sgz500959]|uniref:polysaccharide deacetylase family protein n=1 Tax=Pelosinus sp. sgz500959 TaxID=3242472 RepID=UPI00366B23EB
MTKKNNFFKSICMICAICFIALVSAPLITLAIPATQTLSTLQIIPTSQPLEKEPPPMETANPNTNLTEPTTNNKPEYDQFTFSERQERNLPTILPVTEPYYGDKVIYLTFDDGPDLENTPLILDILKENNIKATFFVLGTEVKKYPDLLKRVYDEGHAIGNHSYNHIYRDLYQSEHTYIEQLHHNDDIIKSIINVRPHISRAPGGSAGNFTKAYWNILKQQGYIEVGWNISSGDASHAKAEQLLNNIIQQTEKNTFLWSHAILLMHDGKGHSETVKALPRIIKFYKEKGFTFQIINSKTPSAW